ncbi:hypothetical protein [Singulisphaera acidiphila]|uniref:hypothetical protein n=1 Tax=Singulisphaera acidiphila TaxID=466153 RepID=UPI0002ED119A|nr:hypothetical protein [Singulisphaera acidiphila]
MTTTNDVLRFPAADGRLRLQRPRELIEFFFRLALVIAVPLLQEAGQRVAFAGESHEVLVGQLGTPFLGFPFNKTIASLQYDSIQ